LNDHASTGSPYTGSDAARDWSRIGSNFEEVKDAIVSRLGDLRQLAEGKNLNIIEVGTGKIEYNAFLQPSGEVSVNFWITNK